MGGRGHVTSQPITHAQPCRCVFFLIAPVKRFCQLFEGLKVYIGEDKRLRLFRPMLNMKRMSKSAKRVCLPVRREGYDGGGDGGAVLTPLCVSGLRRGRAAGVHQAAGGDRAGLGVSVRLVSASLHQTNLH